MAVSQSPVISRRMNRHISLIHRSFFLSPPLLMAAHHQPHHYRCHHPNCRRRCSQRDYHPHYILDGEAVVIMYIGNNY